jgi:hypothetical protein
MKPKRVEKDKKASCRQTPNNWHQMNRKQRREMTRKIQSEDLSLEVVHPDAAGIDIGNESHYVAVPPTRDSQQPTRTSLRMYDVGTEGDGGVAKTIYDGLFWKALLRRPSNLCCA